MLRVFLFLALCFVHTLHVLCMNISIEVDSVTCYGNSDGQVTVNISDSENLYTLRLMEEKNNRLIKRIDFFTDTLIKFSGLKANKYILQIIYNGKSEENLIKISEPAKLSGKIIIEKYPTSKETCDGVIYLEPSGGTEPYTYKWNEGGKDLNTKIVTELCEKIYTCELFDANGCSEIVSTAFLFNDNTSKVK